MPEPITIALSAFAAVKAGVAGAKSMAELGKDLGTLWQAIDDVKADAKGAKKSSGCTDGLHLRCQKRHFLK